MLVSTLVTPGLMAWLGFNDGKALGERKHRRLPIADERGLVVIRQVVGELQRVSGSHLLAAVEDTVGAAEHRGAEGRIRESDPRREVGFLRRRQGVGVAVLARKQQLPRCEIEIGEMVVNVDRRRVVFVAQADVHRQMAGHFEIVLDEQRGNVLAVAQIDQGVDVSGQGNSE